ncbi:abortive infection family protein [Pediococcus acidilactici]
MFSATTDNFIKVLFRVTSTTIGITDDHGDIGHHRSLVNKTLGMKPDNRWDKNVSSLISGLNKIVDSITTMRNINSDSHGSSNRVKINEAEAELILNSAVNISVYYLRVDGRKEKNSVNITKTS